MIIILVPVRSSTPRGESEYLFNLFLEISITVQIMALEITASLVINTSEIFVFYEKNRFITPSAMWRESE